MQTHCQNFGIITNHWQILIGIVALLTGSCIYLFDRPSGYTYFIVKVSLDLNTYNLLPNLFSKIGNYLPSFIHTFAFILITAGVISSKKKDYIIICTIWFVIDCTFELGQNYSSMFVNMIPGWFSGIPFIENTKNYFMLGTFDVLDLAAIISGSLVGYSVLIMTMKKENLEV